MFVSKKKHEMQVGYFDREIARCHENYWELRHKYDRLMNYLGLFEHTNSGIEIRKKSDPETD